MIINNNAREEWDRAHASYSKVAMSLDEYTSLLHFVADGIMGAALAEGQEKLQDEAMGFAELENETVVEDLIPAEEPIIYDEVTDNDLESLIYQAPFEGFPC